MMLNKEPVYLQICNILKGMIEEGEFRGGDRFLTEREVSQKFDVSRTTANKSLSSLVGEGILTYKKGVGTFVSYPEVEQSCDFMKFLRKQQANSYEIKVFCERPFDEIPDVIQKEFSSTDRIYYIMTIYRTSEKPLLISRKYININYEIESAEYFLDNLYDKYSGLNKEVSITKLKKNDAILLKQTEGDSVYLMKEILSFENSVIYDVSLMTSENISLVMNQQGHMDYVWEHK